MKDKPQFQSKSSVGPRLRVLFSLDPLNDLNDPGIMAGWLEWFERIDTQLASAQIDYTGKLLCYDASISQNTKAFEGRRHILLQKHIRLDNTLPGIPVNELDRLQDDAPQLKTLASQVRNIVGDFIPDLLILMSETRWLRIAYPDAAHLNIEVSWLFRDPYPSFWNLDPVGWGKGRILEEYAHKIIPGHHLNSNDLGMLSKFKKKAHAAVCANSQAENWVAKLRHQSNRVILVPLAERLALDGRTPVFAALDALFDDISISETYIITEHPGESALTAKERAYLSRKPNIHFPPAIPKIDTQRLLPWVDAVIADFSSVSIQALLFNVDVYSVADRLAFADHLFAHRSPLARLLKNQDQEFRDKLLHWLLTHYMIDEQRLFDGKWLSNFMLESIKHSSKPWELFKSPILTTNDLSKHPWPHLPNTDQLQVDTAVEPIHTTGSDSNKASFAALAKTVIRIADTALAPEHPPSIEPTPSTDARQRYDHAAALIATGRKEEGAEALIALATEGTPVWEVYADLAEFALLQNDQEAALELMLMAAERAPYASRAVLGAAVLQAGRSEFEPALATLSPYLRQQPNDADALALVRHILGIAPELSAIAWARLLADLRYEAVSIRATLTRQQDALQKLRADAAAVLEPPAVVTTATTTVPIASNLLSKQNEARELPIMQTTVTDQDRQQVELARSLIAQNQLAEAADILSALVLAETPLFEAYYDLGSLAVRQDNLDAAISLFGMALERDPDSTTARHNLALVQSIEQHYEEALSTLSPLLRSGHAGYEDYGLVRDILGKAPVLGSIAWARLLSDMRTPSAEQKKALDEYEALRHQLTVQKAESGRLHAEIAELRAELRCLVSTPSTEARNAAWQEIHILPDEDWLNVLIRSVQTPSYRGFPLPGFPTEGLQTGAVGSSNESALREGFNFYSAVKTLCASHGNALTTDTRLLDFGTGWGRYSRIFMKEIPPDNITGVDVDPSLIKVCRDTFPYCNFEVVPSFPPTELPAGHFDLVVAYSVFSHLSEAAATAWIEEFARILAPGGMIAITTQGRNFLEYCEHIRRSGEITHPWHLKLANSFTDLEASQAAYDRGEFLYSATGGGDARPSSFYGEALVPPGFVERVWSHFLEPVAYIDDGQLPQALIVMRKPL